MKEISSRHVTTGLMKTHEMAAFSEMSAVVENLRPLFVLGKRTQVKWHNVTDKQARKIS